MSLIVLLVLVTLLSALFTRLSSWFASVTLGVLLLGFIWFAGSNAMGRSALPLLVFALGFGLVMGVSSVQQSSRIAPARRKRPKNKKPKMGIASSQGAAAASFNTIGVPGYEVLEKVGSGGMASVYRAKREADGKTVALKIPMEQYVADAKFIRRFHREAEVAQRLDHENIVRTFEHGSAGTKHFMSMEFVDGRSLEGYVESGEMNTDLSVEVMKAVAKALRHIHSVGIIHRDIKPANIMIIRDGLIPGDRPRLKSHAVKLMDFGIAGGKILSRLTMTGARVGTPIYMSPEQARGLKIDHRSDIYSLGLVFYEMLTGQTAFKGGYEAIVHQQIFQTPPPPRQLNLDIPKKLDTLIMKMIAKEPDERPKLSDVLTLLESDDFEENVSAELPSRIILTVSSRQGVLRVLDTQGSLHTSMGNIGVGEGSFAAAPLSVALDTEGNYYAAIFEYRVGQDTHRMIHKLTPEGKAITSFGPYGMKPGEFLYPVSVAVAPNGNVYALDSETHMIQCFDSEGTYLFNFGGRGGGKGVFSDPRVIKIGPDGMVYILDYGNQQVQRLSAEGRYQTRWAFKIDATQTGMRALDGFTVDNENNLYISDATGGKVRKITPESRVALSYAIEPLQGEATDTLIDLGVDDQGFLYASRRGGHLIRKYDLAGRLSETIETYAPVVQMIVDAEASVPA